MALSAPDSHPGAAADPGAYVRPMEIRVLGPVDVREKGRSLPLGGPKQRALLALLVAGLPRVVETDALVEGLWGEEASAGSRSTLQTYVSNLRQVLGDVLVHVRNGYRLEVDPGLVDSVQFTRGLEESRLRMATAPDTVATELRRVLAMWRGRPYADLMDVPGLEPEIRRLEFLRLEAVELRIEAELVSGHHFELLAELEGLAEEYPTRERFRGGLKASVAGKGHVAMEAPRAAGASIPLTGSDQDSSGPKQLPAQPGMGNGLVKLSHPVPMPNGSRGTTQLPA